MYCVRYGQDVVIVNDELKEKFDAFWIRLMAAHASRHEEIDDIDQLAKMYSLPKYRELWPDFHLRSDARELADIVFDRYQNDRYIERIEKDLRIEAWQTGKFKRPDNWKNRRRRIK